mgnify:CR=1 FL=1
MLSYYAELDGSGTIFSDNFMSITYGSYAEAGLNCPFIIDGLKRKFLCERRSDLDFLKTGKAQFAGDHDCSNLQISGDVTIPVSLSGAVKPYDPTYGINPSQWRVPDTYYGYNIQDVMSIFGTVYSPTKVMMYRKAPLGFYTSLKNQVYPITFGKTCVMSFGASMASTASQRYSLSGQVLCIEQTCSTDSRRPIFIAHSFGYEFRYSPTGDRTSSYINGVTYVIACQASTVGGSSVGYVYLKPDGSWSTRRTPYTSPSIFQSPSETTMREIFANPYCLFGTTEIDPSVIQSTNSIQKVVTNQIVKASYDDSFSAMFAYNESLTRYVFRRVYLRKSQPTPLDWTELGDTAADNINQVNINSLAYLRDLGSIAGTLRQSFNLAGNPTDPKAWASWWLSLRYGDRLTYYDTLKLSKAVSHQLVGRFKGWKKDFYTSHAFGTVTEYSDADDSEMEIQRYIKLYFKPKYTDQISSVIRKALEWDLWPTLENSWDLIPFSFVVDWFINVQDALESVDRKNLLMLYSVLSVVQTEKRIYTFDDTLIDNIFVTNLRVVAYERNLGRSLPSAPFRIERGHLATINIVDGISLVCQAY